MTVVSLVTVSIISFSLGWFVAYSKIKKALLEKEGIEMKLKLDK